MVGPLSVCLFPVVIIAYLTLHHSVSFLVAFRAVLTPYFLCFVPGYVCQRWVFKFRKLPPFESILSSFVLGLLLMPPVWYIARWTGLGMPTLCFTTLLGLALPILGRWHRCLNRECMSNLVGPGDAVILWATLGLTMLWSCSLTVVDRHDGIVRVMPYPDHASHMTVIGELGRGIPMQAVPFVAGPTTLSYHLMPDVWCDMLCWATGADLETAYFKLALTLRYLFFCFACYLALLPRFGRAASAVAVVATLTITGAVTYAVPLLKTVMFSNWLLHYFHCNYPSAFGLALIFLVIYYVSRIGLLPVRSVTIVSSCLACVLLWYKANFALALLPAVLLFNAVVLLRKRDYRWLVLCTVGSLLLVVLRRWELSFADFVILPVMQPSAFLAWWWNRLIEVPPGWPINSIIGDGTWILAVGRPWQWGIVLIVCMTAMFHVSLLSIPYLVSRCGWRRRLADSSAADLLSLIFLLVTVLGLAVFPVQLGHPGNIGFALRAAMWAVLGPLLGVMVYRALRYMSKRNSWGRAFAAVIVLAILVQNARPLRASAFWQTRYGPDKISADLHDCYRFIKDATPAEAMVLQENVAGPWTAGLLTQRRVVLEMEYQWRHWFYDTLPIAYDVKRFYNGANDSEALRILRRYGITHIVADLSRHALPLGDDIVREIFRKNTTVVLEVRGEMLRNDAGVCDEHREQKSPDHEPLASFSAEIGRYGQLD